MASYDVDRSSFDSGGASPDGYGQGPSQCTHGRGGLAPIQPHANRFPCCLVWTPIPLLTWLLPFVGHLGIADSAGVIHDFAGPYFVSVDDFAFGRPTRYLPLHPEKCCDVDWDRAVRDGSEVYRKRMHILCFDNCHSHVACCMNRMRYGDFRHWNMVILAFYMFFFGRYLGWRGVLVSWLPFVLLVSIVLVLAFYVF